MMRVTLRSDHVEVEGYVNSVERNSKPITDSAGHYIERMCAGSFTRALNRNNDVHILLNHDWTRDLGSTAKGSLELHEDSIGLHARATIYDSDVIDKARNGDLVGWSFGFTDVDVDESSVDSDTNLPLRKVRDLNLEEVSILDKTRTPAYAGTLINTRDNNKIVVKLGEELLSDCELVDESKEDTKTRDVEPSQEETKKPKFSYYSEAFKMLKEAI